MRQSSTGLLQAEELTVRPATPQDAPCLVRLDQLVNGDAGRSFGHFQLVCGNVDDGGNNTAGECAMVLEWQGLISAFALFSRVLDEATLHSIGVDPKLQGRGLGRRLLTAMLAQVGRVGASRCLLEVRESNAAARSLYNGLGFSLDGVRKNYYPTPKGREDALLMSAVMRKTQ